MTRRSLSPIRRSRALLAWALCAWLALFGMAWAQTDCCTGMHMHDAMHHVHAHGTATADCTCLHAPAPVPRMVAVGRPGALTAAPLTMPLDRDAPQPSRAPPLRPPAIRIG